MSSPTEWEMAPVERWFARTFGDDAPKTFGTGWISGTLSVFLAACGLGSVLVLHFPEWLSSAELRDAYPMGLMRSCRADVIPIQGEAVRERSLK
jgi:hypothetical protein